MSYTLAFTADWGTSNTGLTVHGHQYDTTGALIATITTGILEVEAGVYQYTATLADGSRGSFVLYNSSGSTTRSAFSINPQEGENVDAKVSSVGSGGASNPLSSEVPGSYVSGTAGYALGRIGSGGVNTVSPISSTNIVTLVRGDDYFATEGRALEWIDTSAQWPELTSGSVVFTAEKTTNDSTLTVNGSVVTPTGDNKKVRAEPSSAQMGELLIGDYNYDVQITLVNGHKITLVSKSPMKVLEDFSA